MLLLIDNYDSFVYNLYQLLARQLEGLMPCRVIRNDALSVSELLALQPQGIVLSPGPGRPEQAGVCLELIRAAAARLLPLLGVCLGHQALAQAFGGRVVPAPQLMHGKRSQLQHKGQRLFAGLPNPMTVARYHSLVVEAQRLPPELVITAQADDGCIMALQHLYLPLVGVQFHPESLTTVGGQQLLQNFLDQQVLQIQQLEVA
ncbi:MAG: aminodeoxychorismate/anthranilate synthase component II [Candidatus Sericytochromatia bacterium]|nr:aminodeoxychorismate/anthranilate synthase component II [Candidatus Sericytochromatia bacterium]